MNAGELILFCEENGIFLTLEENEIKVSAKKGAVTPAIKMLLKDNKAELLAVLRSTKKAIHLSDYQSYGSRTEGPLSFSQKSLWFMDKLENGSAVYNIPTAFRLQGALDIPALEQTFKAVISAHSILRTVFVEDVGSVKQRVITADQFSMNVLDYRPTDVGAVKEKLQQLVNREAVTPFDLTCDLMVRVKLVICSDSDYCLLITQHHIASDGWSVGVLIKELSYYYEKFSNGVEVVIARLPLQYIDYAAWQNETFTDQYLEKSVEYWLQQLSDIPVLHSLPLDKARPAKRSFHGENIFHILDMNMKQKLLELSVSLNSTPFIVMYAAFSLLIYKYSSTEDIVIGTPTANRSSEDLNQLIGFFVNNLALRVKLNKESTFSELVSECKSIIFSALKNQQVPFDYLVEKLKPERSLSYSPLFQIMFVYQNNEKNILDFGDIKFEIFDQVYPVSKYDLTLEINEFENGLGMRWEYATDLFDRRTIENFLESYTHILKEVIEKHSNKLCNIDAMSARQFLDIVNKGRHTIKENRNDGCIYEKFEHYARDYPGHVAVVAGGKKLCYAELNFLANQLANWLILQGVHNDSLIGLSLSPSLEMIIGIVGILKSGAAYVPLDPNYPTKRLQYIVEDTDLQLILFRDRLDIDYKVTAKSISLNHEGNGCFNDESLASASGHNPVLTNQDSGRLAYIIYTSGSSGLPKGVMVEHRNVTRLFDAKNHGLFFNSNDTWLLFHSFAFDFSVWEMWGALSTGGKLVVIDRDLVRSPECIFSIVRDQGVTVLNQTPSAFYNLSDYAVQYQRLETLRYVIFGGEALDLERLKPWMDLYGDNKPSLVNMYGITEITVHATRKVITKADLASSGSLIGRPYSDLSLYILDDQEKPCPVGVIGEVYIGGRGVARGYLNNPDLTSKKFIRNPFGDVDSEMTLYKSGDLAKWMVNGELQFYGRNDSQVKIRGHRIEINEIESAFRKLDNIKDCRVIDREYSGSKRLVAFIILNPTINQGDKESIAAGILNIIKSELPPHMIPSAVKVVENIPLNANGKMDTSLLPEVMFSTGSDSHYIAPRNEREKLLCSLWQDVLGVSNVGIRDNFFSLGGDSILTIKLVTAARQSGFEMDSRALFEFQTIELLAGSLNYSPSETHENRAIPDLLSAADSALLPLDAEDAYPVSSLQAGMLFHNEFDGEFNAYKNVSSFRVSCKFLEAEFFQALEALINKHEILRTGFDFFNYSRPIQIVYRTVDVPLTVHDKTTCAPKDVQIFINDLFQIETQTVFDIAKAPLINVTVVKISGEKFQLIFSEHHAILDGWSVALLFTELFENYFTILSGETLAWKRLSSRYKGYVAQELFAIQDACNRDFWNSYLRGMVLDPLQLGDLSTRVYSTEGAANKGVRIDFNQQLFNALKHYASSLGVPIRTVLLAVHTRIIGFVLNKCDVVTGLVTNGRLEQRDGENVPGLFLNSLPFRFALTAATWTQLVRKIFDVEKEISNYKHYPLASIQKDQGGSVLFDTLFNFVHFHAYQSLDLNNGFDITTTQSFERTNFNLVANFCQTVDGREMFLQLQFNEKSLSTAQAQRIAGYYERGISQMLANPSSAYEDLCLFSDAELRTLRNDWNASAAPYPRDKCIHHLIEEQVMRTPENIALIHREDCLTYRELYRQAYHLACELQHRGGEPDALIGVALGKGIEQVITVLAVMLSGAAYLPLDVGWPQERQNEILRSAKARLVIVPDASQVDAYGGCDALVYRRDTHTEQPAGAVVLKREVAASDLAYVIFTSGSTGKPKGVAIEHRSALNTILDINQRLELSERDRVFALSGLSFDLSVYDLFGPLCVGGAIVMPTEDERMEPARWLPHVRAGGVTVWDSVPALYQLFIEQVELSSDELPLPLRVALLSGDWIALGLPRRSRAQLPDVALLSLGGATEASIWSISYPIGEVGPHWRSIPYGKPLNNQRFYILDQALRHTPIGVKGDLYIAGDGLARCYWEDHERTAASFIEHGELKERLYRTGDKARYLEDGNIEFLGREDTQVKIRGYRIELGEIEAQLSRHEQVKESVVIVGSDVVGEQRILAYVVPQDGGDGVERLLRRHLEQVLPVYMLPTDYVLLEELPLSVNGKIDRQALPKPAGRRGDEDAYQAPVTVGERILCEIWERVLKVERVGTRDNFFGLGGDSILSIQVVSQANARGIGITTRQIFECQTIEAIITSSLSQADDVIRRLTYNTIPALESRCFGIGEFESVSIGSLYKGTVKIPVSDILKALLAEALSPATNGKVCFSAIGHSRRIIDDDPAPLATSEKFYRVWDFEFNENNTLDAPHFLTEIIQSSREQKYDQFSGTYDSKGAPRRVLLNYVGNVETAGGPDVNTFAEMNGCADGAEFSLESVNLFIHVFLYRNRMYFKFLSNHRDQSNEVVATLFKCIANGIDKLLSAILFGEHFGYRVGEKIAEEIRKINEIKLPSSYRDSVEFGLPEKGPRIFLIPPSTVGSECYYHLAKKISRKYSVVILENIETYSGIYFPLAEVSEHYLRIIRTYQPEGPYIIGGWSRGAHIAHYIADGLARAGGLIDLLIMMDPIAPSLEKEIVDTINSDSRVAHLSTQQRNSFDAVASLLEYFSGLSEYRNPMLFFRARLLPDETHQIYSDVNTPYANIINSHLAMSRDFSKKDLPLNGYGKVYCKGEIIELEGTHVDVLTGSNCDLVAEAIIKHLNKINIFLDHHKKIMELEE
jgi:amino acid adenylation domain-containing protein